MTNDTTTTEWDWADQANDPAYLAWVEQEQQRRDSECGDTYATGGSDPWSFTCDQPKGHTGEHSMAEPMGPDTPTFTWRRNISALYA